MRRRRSDKREIVADPQFNSKLVQKFINIVMLAGQKSTAERLVYNALDRAKQKLNESNGLDVFTKAVENVRPLLELKSRRVGGATYQIPVEVSKDRGVALAMHWLREYARGRRGRPFDERLADELVEAFRGQGAAVKKREDTHKMAEANRAFAHYRW